MIPKNPRGMPLSDRQLQVVQHLADGLGNKEAAAALAMSERTLECHCQAVRAKLGAETRCHMIAIAMRQGLIS